MEPERKFQPIYEDQKLINYLDSKTGIYLHSKRDPVKEAHRISERLLSTISEKSRSLFLLGIGAGFHLSEMLPRLPKNLDTILVWDPYCDVEADSPELAKEWRELAHRKQIKLYLEKSLEDCGQILKNCPSPTTFPLPYWERQLQGSIQEALSLLPNRNQIAKAHFARTWIYHYFRNLVYGSQNCCQYLPLPSVQKTTAIYCGASPSLESEIEIIQKSRDHAFFVSCDTASRYLVQNGIQPDLVVSLDSGRGTVYHLQGLPDCVPILTWFGAHPYIFELPNPKIIYFSSHPLDQVLLSVIDPESEFIPNPTLDVSGLSIQYLHTLGFSQIYLAGLSFEATAGKSHCRGSGYELFWNPYTDRTHTFESQATSKEYFSRKETSEILKAKIFQIPGTSPILSLTGGKNTQTEPISFPKQKTLPPFARAFWKQLQIPAVRREVELQTNFPGTEREWSILGAIL